MEDAAKIKSKAFALRIINLYKYLCDEQKEYVMSKQILRSGTGIGANLAEARRAISKKNFLSKVYFALKECSETEYWLELLYESGFIKQEWFESIYEDCQELLRILNATTKKIMQQNQEKKS